jgi:hypothetical protein
MDWYYQVVSVAESFVVLDRPYINYRQRENSVTSAFNPKSISDYVITLEKWYARLDKTEDLTEREALLSSLAKLYCNFLIEFDIQKYADDRGNDLTDNCCERRSENAHRRKSEPTEDHNGVEDYIYYCTDALGDHTEQ